jgi:hypothetical protein
MSDRAAVQPRSLTSRQRSTLGFLLSPGGFAGSDQPGLVGEDHGLDAVAKIEFGEDPSHVGFDGAVADEERGGDLGAIAAPMIATTDNGRTRRHARGATKPTMSTARANR